MSTPARIDELRKKFDENPRRYFAPLANEYRKAGDLERAIALCREYLPKQPGHMSGHIVFGQALYEAGELAEARSVFESALTLDPENLIALRHLGDIAKMAGDAADARRWYERVLDADPRNDDIAAQLATLALGTTPVSVPVTPDVPSTANVPRSRMTPPYGVGALPTPYASMRAVDFDEVNARIARFTPLHVDAIELSVERDQPAAEAADASENAAPADANVDAEHAADGEESGRESLDRNTAAAPPVAHPEAPTAFEPLDLDAMERDDFAVQSERQVAQEEPRQGENTDDAQALGEPAEQAVHALGSEIEEGSEATDYRDAARVQADGTFDDAASEYEPNATNVLAEAALEVESSSESRDEELAVAALNHESEVDETRGVVEATEDEAIEVERVEDEAIGDEAIVEATVDEEETAETPQATAEASAEAPALEYESADETSDEGEHALAALDIAGAFDDDAASDDESDDDHPAVAAAGELPEAEFTAEDFEDGILAPEWPQASEVIAKLGTPRSSTPVSVQVTPEAAIAFGREANEPMEREEVAEELSYDALAIEMPEYEALDSDDLRSESPLHVESVKAVAQASDDTSADHTEPETAQVSEHAVATDVEPDTGSEAEPETDDVPLPWLSVESEDALADDADDDEMLQFDAREDEVLDVVSADDEASFAHLMDREASDAAVEEEAEPQAQLPSPPAFVTETMGELLVSQGFIQRAADVYEELVRRRPYDPVLTSRLAELREQLVAESDEVAEEEVPHEQAESIGEFVEDAEPEAVHPETPARSATPLRSMTPVYSATPIWSDALRATPVSSTPVSRTPYSSPSTETRAQAYDHEGEVRITSRELFARLAMRRVPRRTPSQSTAAVSESPDGLAALFGGSGMAHDDVAARALADAFAPISEHEMASGATLDLDFGRPPSSVSTPAWTPALSIQQGQGHGGAGSAAAPAMTPASASPANAGFSFDRFFPDPATEEAKQEMARDTKGARAPNASQHEPSPAPAPAPAPAPDDLAQFSAWLKGLGNT